MKTKNLIRLAGVSLAAGLLIAASPAYVTKSSTGTAAAPASVIFPADPSSQIRVVNVNYSTDTNNSSLYFASGTTAYSIQFTNYATSATTNCINSTNGLSGSAVLVLQHNGVCYSAVVSSWAAVTNQSLYTGYTNVVLASGGWGVATSVGDSVYLMSTPVTASAPAASSGTTTIAAVNGEALYVASYQGRPVSVTLKPALVTNNINNAVVHYD